MKKIQFFPLLLGTLLSGCAAGHSIEQQANGLVFSLHLPKAKQVQIACSTDNYMFHDAERNGNGNWQITIPNPAAMKYFYVVDGISYLPECKLKETDDFGSENCIYQP